jgi:hypothetical protein
LKSRRERLSRDVLFAVLLGFAAILILGATAFFGVFGVAVTDVQNLLVSLNLNLNQPTAATDVFHFGVGFTVGLVGYIAVTSLGPKRIRLEGRPSRRRSTAITALVGILLVATFLILAKEFFFDTTFEQATALSGLIDLITYAVGLGAALAAALALE